MKLFDRYTNKTVSEQDLPNQLDFGRYCIVQDSGNTQELTYSNSPPKIAIQQDILLPKYNSLQDIFLQILSRCDSAKANDFSVIPLMQRITDKLGLNEFEKLLYEKVFHLEEIFRAPHYLLEREIEKVHVSRAKRIPSKSYQYLASHTEDWVHKSIVSFKPSRILNEELDLNFDIYENQLTIAIVERCLIYLNSRLKEIQDIKAFHLLYQELLNKDFSKGWHEKLHRNFKLMGSAYDDKNYKPDDGLNDQRILSATEEVINQINKRLLLLRKSVLFDLVNKRAIQSVSFYDTNVLVNHKHYRYVKILWNKLLEIKPQKSESEKLTFEQNVIKGIRAYAKGLITYALISNLDCKVHGTYSSFRAKHLHLCDVSFNETNRGIFEINIGEKKISIVVTGNLPEYDDKFLSLLKTQNTYILYFDENLTFENSRFIHINPLDPDSVERVCTMIRKYMLLAYLSNIKTHYKFKQLLKEYVKYIITQYLEFDVTSFTYSFHSYPKSKLSLEEVIDRIEKDSLYKSKSRPDRENIISSLKELLSEIEENIIKLKEEYLNCFNCSERLHSFNIQRLDYIKCPTCSCLVDSSNFEKVTFKIDDARYSNLERKDFGMDCLTINMGEL
jgi:DNA-directed RNA polymerase subunit RPC12/RpoP